MAKRALIIGLVLLFGYWIYTVVIPILGVEVSYQFKRNFRDLVWPQFRVNLTTGTFTTDGISIPSIFVDEPVVYNVDPNNKPLYMAALLKGIAHASGTAFPGTPPNGRTGSGLGYYFAHSSSPSLVRQYNAVFYLLGRLQNGDKITLYHSGNSYNYSVYDKQITIPSDLSFLHKTYPTETIVMQTCWPPGTTFERLLVFALRTQ